jgi:hypothetical protein
MDKTDLSAYYKANISIRKTKNANNSFNIIYPTVNNFVYQLDPIYKPIISQKLKKRIYKLIIMFSFVALLQRRSGIFL